MIRIDFSEEEINALETQRYNHPHSKVQKKMEVLYLKAKGVQHKEICRLCKISGPTLCDYLKQYIEGGITGLTQLNWQGAENELKAHTYWLEAYFEDHPCQSVNEVRAKIEELTGIKRSPTQIREFMRFLGLRCLKVGHVPGKATDPAKIEEQETFRTNELEPRLAEAKAGKRKVYFMDAVHFVHAAFLGFVWCFERLFIPSPSGRKRLNILGVLDAVTNELITISNETYINSNVVCQMLIHIANINQHLKIPITIVLDNASYQKCLLVQCFAETLNIELLYLPTYSPHLNLIERVWGFIKKDCLYSKYYPNFKLFKKAIFLSVEKANNENKDKLKTLLTWNFQSFKKVKISTV